MAETPNDKICLGRGGRGAMILAALKNQPRRPGEGATEEPAQTTTEKPLGRGAFLKSLLPQVPVSRGRGILPSTAEVPDPPKSFVGRGRGLALSGILSESPEAKSPSPTPSPSSAESPASLAPKFEELKLEKYTGTSGNPLNLEVNYVRLRILGDVGIHEYHVSFKPSVDSKRLKFSLIGSPEVKDVIGMVRTFDGSKLYLPRRLQALTEINSRLHTDNSLITVCIKYIKQCQPSDLIHLYNVLFGKVMRILKMTRVGRNHFDAKSGIPVPQHRLEIWPGYVTAVQEYEGGVMLNCDCSFRVLRTITAADIMQDFGKTKRDVKENVMKALIGNVVLTRYNNKSYRVDDIAWDKFPTSTFQMKDGSETTFVAYYKREYDENIKHLDLPLLISKAKARAGGTNEDEKLICLIPEFSFMTGLTDELRNDFKVMKDIATFTRVTPERRQFALMKFVSNVNDTPEAKECFTNWNLALENAPLSLDGRLYKPEMINFGNGVKVQASAEADWGRQATTNPVLVSVNFEKWAIIYTKRDAPRAMDFVKMLRNVCPAMNIMVRDPQKVEILNDRTDSYCEALKDIINPTVQIVVIIFPTARDDRYSAVKKLCCVELPVPSQCINSKTISQPQKLRSVVQKIALQMNCKLGGELWSVTIPIKNLMVCGLDTYHDASRAKKSVLAFVASMNENRTRWFSMTTMQRPGQEAGDSLKVLFTNALRKYFEMNHCLPDKVVLFRDGVGDGQLSFIQNYEVEQLKSVYKSFNNYEPDLFVVVVQKRINTRMYNIRQERGQRTLANPPPGSVLDHTVTRKGWYDFFLVSQHVRQGTVSPTHYVVIHNASSLKPDHMQRLTYKMTHLYYNWPGTVRVPAPCQYAHKLAYLVGQNLHKETHTALSDRLFYL